jgi:hypothetical protein
MELQMPMHKIIGDCERPPTKAEIAKYLDLFLPSLPDVVKIKRKSKSRLVCVSFLEPHPSVLLLTGGKA